MNDNLIFHIGLHKTGTTYLQSHLFKKLDVNLIRGWESHRDLLKKSHKRRTLISDEGISGDFMSDNYDKIFYENLNKISKWYNNPFIIFGIREQSKFIISLYTKS